MKDRISKYPGRVRLTPVEGQENVFDIERMDEPLVIGTKLNARNLLPDYVAEALGLTADNDPVPADAFRAIAEKLGELISAVELEESEGEITAIIKFDDGSTQQLSIKFDESGKTTYIIVDGRVVPVKWEAAE